MMKPFYQLGSEEALAQLDTTIHGLSISEAKKRLTQYGRNVLPEKKKISRLIIFIAQFKSALVYILLAATIVSFALGETIDAAVILAAVFLNIIVGYIQENKAQRSLEALRKVITLKANVLRQNKETDVDAAEVVPGDLLVLRAGDKIPADARLLESTDLTVNEASLTGESEPRKKFRDTLNKKMALADRSNQVFMGTTVLSGTARAVIVGTGSDTEIGTIAELLKNTEEEITPLQKKLAAFSRSLALVVLVISATLLVTGLLLGYHFIEIFEISVAVAVAAIPEGLAVEVTIILAIGMQQILKRKGLVRKLVAAETLGSTTVICTDKTGTLTEGRMKVTKIVTWDKDFSVPTNEHDKNDQELLASTEFSRALHIGILCNDAFIKNPEDDFTDWVVIGNPTERALMVAGRLVGLRFEELIKKEPRVSEIPFDSRHKFMITQHHFNKQHDILYVKGAPEKLIVRTRYVLRGNKEETITEQQKKSLIEKYEQMSREGLRVISVGYKKITTGGKLGKTELPESIVWVAFMGIEDPLRKEAKETIRLCQKAGVKVVVITGDNKLTAQSIAKQLGLKVGLKNILEGEEMDRLSPKQLKAKVPSILVYARVSPQDKLRIVDAWQARGEVVAMTGDGVNDAPALKAADIGVALGSGTEVAKETANLVLLDDNFATIEAAVERGRVIFDNLKKVTLYLLSDSFSEIVLIISALFLRIPLPILATQILWINLVNDGLPNVALALDPKEEGIMNEPPRHPKAPILDHEMKLLIVVGSLVSGLGSLILFLLFMDWTGNVELARTVVFTALAVDSLLYIFSIRSMRQNIWHGRIFNNGYLIGAVIVSFLLQLLAIYLPFFQTIFQTRPLGWFEWTLVLIECFFVVIAIELIKYWFIVKQKRSKK